MTILVRYDEIALKGGNRVFFQKKLAANIRQSLARLKTGQPPMPLFENLQINCHFDHILIHWGSPENEPGVAQARAKAVRQVLEKTFGVSSFSPIHQTVTDLDAIKQQALSELDGAITQYERTNNEKPKTFAVRTKRTEKLLNLPSHEIDREVGGHLKSERPWLMVQLKSPDLTVGIDIRSAGSSLWSSRFPGPQGLPVGVNAPLLALLSGGIDSPVAAIQMIKRGSRVALLHFHGTPFVGAEVLEKVQKLAALVNEYQPRPQALFVVPFGGLQEKIALQTPPRYRTLLYRRMMLRISERIARTHKLRGLITGESVGQVASQTIENLSTIQEACRLLVLRPLIAEDKLEITVRAKRWGTYSTSILPALDCCTLFADSHPVLNASIEQAHELEAKLPIEDWIVEAIAACYRL